MHSRALCPCIQVLVTAFFFFVTLKGAEPPRKWEADAFAPLTLARVETLPASERSPWVAYLRRSDETRARSPKQETADFSPLQPLATPPAGGSHSRGLNLKASKQWFAGTEAQTIADRVVAAQTIAGGWTKGVDYTRPASEQPAHKPDVWSGGTLDNDATITELRQLALTSIAATDPARAVPWNASFVRGLNYLLEAQYPNGGFPQIYPLVGGYHDAITYNDDAMVNALELLRDVAAGKPEFAFVPEELRLRCASAVARGVECILKTQIVTASGQRTVWCQQHDALTLKPCAARNFEPIAACSAESAEIVRFLSSLAHPTEEVRAAIDSAAAWFVRTAIHGFAWVSENRVHRLVEQSGAPALWARMYEIDTNKPVFGDRDRTIHYAVEEISAERRNGYAWYGNWPASVIDRDHATNERKP